MTTLQTDAQIPTESQKKAALEWIDNLGIEIPYDVALTLYSLLTPTSKDVSEAVEYFRPQVNACDCDYTECKHLKTLIQAATQPKRDVAVLEALKKLSKDADEALKQADASFSESDYELHYTGFAEAMAALHNTNYDVRILLKQFQEGGADV